MDDPTCPYCARAASAGGGQTREHVFVEALGGRAITWACRSCNSTIGHEIEGPLQRPGALLNLLKQALGKGKPLPGMLGLNDTEVTYDITTHELRARRPVAQRRDGDVQYMQVQGSPQQVREILRKQGHPEEEIERLVSAAHQVDLTEEQFSATLTYDLGLADRLAAKVALSGGGLAFGTDFVATPLAGSLREILWGRAMPSQRCSVDALTALDELLGEVCSRAGLGSFVGLQPPPRSSQLVLASLSSDRTVVLVHLAGLVVGNGGLVLPAVLPAAAHGLPVLVRDALGGAHVELLASGVLRHV